MPSEAFDNWLSSYRDAWEEMDPSAAGELFAEDARYRLTPFDDPFEGRDAIENYWSEVTSGQNDPVVEVTTIATEGDRGVGHFNAQFTDNDGAPVEIDGICIVTLDGDTATEFLEWWHVQEK